VISTEEDGEIGICRSCHDEVFQERSWYEIDVMIVPVSKDSFKNVIRQKKYICPERYVRKKPKFIAFYRGGDIGAITHIARVVNVTFKTPLSMVEDILSDQNHSAWMDADEYRIFDLQKPVALKYKITKNGSPAIQNRVYKTFKKFAEARKLRDLRT